MNNGSVNVAPDVIFKLNTSNEGIRVGEDAVLNIQGTGTSPVVFTSLKDDSIAGDTGEDGSTTGTAGDYGTAVNVAGDTAVEITNVDVRYAHTAFGATDGEVSLSNVLYGLVTHYADVVFRGSISNVTHKGIQACNWAPQWPCSVDAAYVDWGSADGPFPPSSPPLVCGRVTVSPWVVGSGTSNAETFDVPNCDNTATPNTLLSGSVTGFNNAVSDEQIDCSNGYQPACDAIEDAFACLGGAIQVAASTTPIPVSFTNPTQTSDTVHADAVAATDSFLQGLEIANPSSFSLGIASGISSVVNLFGALSNAYSNCAP